jgi:hypothetical protein
VPLLVDLADEFHLTTSEALELCASLGIDAEGLGSVLSESEALRVRQALGQDTGRATAGPTLPALGAPGGSGGPGSLADRLGSGVAPPAGHTPSPERPAPSFGGGLGDSGAGAATPGPAPAWGASPPPAGAARPVAATPGPSLQERLRDGLPDWATDNLPVVAICGFAVVVLVAFVALTGGSEGESGPGDGLTYANELLTDECFDLPAEGGSDLDVVAERPCSEPHDVEVIAEVRTYQGRFMDELGDYPGRAALEADALTECLGRFERVVGAPYKTSGLELLAIVPTEATFVRLDDRVSLCGVASPSGEPVDGRAAVLAKAGAPTTTTP